MAGGVSKSCAIILNQFGTLLIQDSYTAKGKSKDEARSHLSILFLVANIISMFSCLLVGYYSDRIRIYYLIIGTSILLVLFFAILVYDVAAANDISELGLIFDISFTLALGFHICTYMLSIS